MAILQGRKQELEAIVREAIVQCKLMGLDPLSAVNQVKKVYKKKGVQLSKEEIDYCTSIADMILNISEVKVEEPQTAGAAKNDAQNIGASAGSFESVEIGAGEQPQPTQSTAQEERVKFKFDDFLQMESDGSFKVKLPKTEEEFGDLLQQVAPKFKGAAIKSIAAATSHIIAKGMAEGATNNVRDTFAKTSVSYQETGKLHPKEQAIVNSFGNLFNAVLGGFMK